MHAAKMGLPRWKSQDSMESHNPCVHDGFPTNLKSSERGRTNSQVVKKVYFNSCITLYALKGGILMRIHLFGKYFCPQTFVRRAMCVLFDAFLRL